MSYVVVWETAATNEVDGVFEKLPPDERRMLVDALQVVNDRLRDDALHLGESRQAGLIRVHTELPMTVHFHVEDRLRRVRVITARVYGQV